MDSYIPEAPQWHYELATGRQGPVDSNTMYKLLRRADISASTLVWRPGMATWVALEHSELASLLYHYERTPARDDDEVDNTFVWLLAFSPVLGILLKIVLAAALTGSWAPTVMQGTLRNLWWVTLALNVLLGTIDVRRLRAAGYNTDAFNRFWVLFVPLYLFNRARYLQQRPTYAWTWVAVYVGYWVFF